MMIPVAQKFAALIEWTKRLARAPSDEHVQEPGAPSGSGGAGGAANDIDAGTIAGNEGAHGATSAETRPVNDTSSSQPGDLYAEASSGGVCIAPSAGPACSLWAAGSMATQPATPGAIHGNGDVLPPYESDLPVSWDRSVVPTGDSFGPGLVADGLVPPEADASGAEAPSDTDYCPGPSQEEGPANTHVDNPGGSEDPLRGLKDVLRPPRVPKTDGLYGEQPKAPPVYEPRSQMNGVDPRLAMLYGVTTTMIMLKFPNTDIVSDIPQPKPEQGFLLGAACILGAAVGYTALTMAPAALVSL